MLKLQDIVDKIVNRENMLILADFLEKNEKVLSFDMRDWVVPQEDKVHVDVTSFDVENKHVCGTAACAIGWARFVVAPLDEHYHPETHFAGQKYQKILNFNQYSTMFIRQYQQLKNEGIDIYSLCDYDAKTVEPNTERPLICITQDLFDFCFGHEWSGKDNSILGAVFRIHYVLDNPNTIPLDWIRGADMEGYNQAKYEWLKQRGYSF